MRLALQSLLLLTVAVCPLAACVQKSGRLDPFPRKMGSLAPDRPSIGIARFDDGRDHPDWLAPRYRSLPPPRVLLEEALFVEFQQKGFNPLTITSPENPTSRDLALLSEGLRLDAIVTGNIVDCEQEMSSTLFGGPSMTGRCSFELVLHDRHGRVLYTAIGSGNQEDNVGFWANADDHHQVVYRAMEEAARNAVSPELIRVFGAYAGGAGVPRP